MKDPSGNIRQWIYNILNGTIFYNSLSVPVYSFPSKDAEGPYICIAEQSMTMDEDETKDTYITDNEVNIEIYTPNTGNDATYKMANNISEDILELVIQRTIETHGSGGSTVATITGFNPIDISLRGSITDRFLFDNKITIYKQLTIKLILEEN